MSLSKLVPALRPAGIFAALVFILTTFTASAATIVWSGASGAGTNWSTGANWAGGVAPTGADDVKFFDAGTNLALGVPNSLVDGGFAGYIGSLQLGNTNGLHTIAIAAGQTLAITNGSLSAGTPTDTTLSKNFTNTITGSGATLYVSNLTANISVNQANSVASPSRVGLNLSGLDNFIVSANRIGIGDGQFPGVPVNNRTGGNLLLAKTNFITLAYSDTLANYQTAGKNSAMILSRNSGNNPGITSVLQLGIQNTFNLDSMNFGMDKSGNNSTAAHGVMVFNPAFAGQNPVANFYGAGGPGTRVTWWSIGDGNQSASSSNGGGGTNDFSLGTVNAFVNVMSLARDAASASDTWAGPHKGFFSFTNGTVDVNTLIVGNQSLETGTSTTHSFGIFNVIGAGALLKINTVLNLGTATLATLAGSRTLGIVNVTNGTVYANNVVVGVNSITNIINLVNGTLIVSNTLVTNNAGLFSLNISNSTIGLTVPANGSLRGLVTTLNSIGATNFIALNSAPVLFSSYPQQFPLIKYTTWNGSNTFGLASIPAWAPGATLVSNAPNKSLDLLLPSDPRPVFTAQPTAYSGNPGDNVTSSFAVTIAAASVTPLSYQWYFVTNNVTNSLANGAGPSGFSTLSGATSANLQIANTQPGDTGNYFVVVANAFATNSSSPALLTISASAIAPTVTGPAAITATNGVTTTIANSVSGSPVPALYWQYNGSPLADGTGPSGSSTISGSSTATLTIANPQRPGDEGTYSLIASNSAGMATNNTVLTVIVPPFITTQPASLKVTNTQSASFTAAATGVPAPWYQWRKNGNLISPAVNSTATNATFTIASATPADMASYSCTITNQAGTTNTITVTLTVNSTMSPVALTPANGATGVCYDTPLYVTFDRAPLTRNAGTIKIYNVTNSVTPVDTLDMSLNSAISQNGTGIPSYLVNVQPRTIAGAAYVTFPVMITSNTAAIYPHGGVMTSNQTYYVTIDAGVFTDTNGAWFTGITNSATWQFTTKPAGPLAGTNYVVVATDGTADFCTVQGAVDFLPNFTGTTASNRVIYLRKGKCVEIVNVPVGKNNLTIRGESRQESLLSYPNSNLINPSSHTVMVLHVRANDIAIENLKLTNSVPQGGSQSFALMVETGAKRFICNNADVDSYQDTILVNTIDNNAYFYKSLVQGDVDFIWGGGNCYFTNCELRELRTGGIYFQPRTPAGSNGMAVVKCQLTRLNGTNASGSNFTNCLFARALGNTNSNVGLIYCNIDTNVVQTGWTASEISDVGLALRWWEYGNSNLDGTLPAVYNGIQLPNNDPRLLLTLNASNWLYGWTPSLAPNILTNPVSQTVNYASSATFTVAATGIPDPTYQWQHAGTNLPSATSATLTIGSAALSDAGSYAVIVTTTSGSATSTTATLTVNPPPNTAPVFTAPITGTNFTINVGVSLVVSCTATDSDTPAQTLTYSLLTAPSGATLNTNTGSFAWRPTVPQSNSVNNVKVAVTDNGTPNLSATNSFTVTVNPLTAPSADAGTYAGGQFSTSVTAQIGPDYALQATTNLAGGTWVTVATTNSPASSPFILTDTNAASQPMQFYRTVTGPPLP